MSHSQARHILIIGAGLIGGSVAKALKAESQSCVITVIDTDESSLKMMREEEVADSAYAALTPEIVNKHSIIITI